VSLPRKVLDQTATPGVISLWLYEAKSFEGVFYGQL
jgi:hypothetical protein